MIRGLCAGVAFLAAIVAANVATSRYGMVGVGFGLTATAGTYLAGLTFLLRDSVQLAVGRWGSVVLIVAGAGLSYLLADPRIALASLVAFAFSEAADLAVWERLKGRGYAAGVLGSNTVGALVDTVLFLWLAGFPIWPSVPGQLVGKLILTAAILGVRDALSRQPMRV